MADPTGSGGAGVLSRREEILDAATDLFAEHGFTETVTQTLADRLQVGKGTIYRHFTRTLLVKPPRPFSACVTKR